MIGNDIVDLQLAARESNWRRKGFLNKVFTEEEQQVIKTSKEPDIIVWLFWSMKEAAYKAHQRENSLRRSLNWRVLQCTINNLDANTASGKVSVNDQEYFTSSELNSNYIYTSAKQRENTGVKNVIFEAPSIDAKNALVEEISTRFFPDLKNFQLKKNASGIPFLTSNDQLVYDQFSLTGHGRYSAYIMALINCETQVKHF